MTLVEDGKTEFIQGSGGRGRLYSRCRDHCSGVLQKRERLESSLSTARASGNLSPRSRVESVDRNH